MTLDWKLDSESHGLHWAGAVKMGFQSIFTSNKNFEGRCHGQLQLDKNLSFDVLLKQCSLIVRNNSSSLFKDY